MMKSSVCRLVIFLFLLTFAVGSSFAFDPAADLLVYYGFEDDLTDSSGNGNDAAVFTGAPTYEAWDFGQAISLAGTKISVGSGALGDMAGKTMAAWINIADVNGNLHFIGSNGAGDRFYVTRITWFTGTDLAGNTGPTDEWFGATPYTLDTWEHIAVSVSGDGLTSTLYVGGSLAGSSTDTGVTLNALMIGGGSSETVNGKCDEFRIYDRVLSAPDVWALYNYGLPPSPTASAPSPYDGATNVNTWTDLSWRIDPSFEYDGTETYKVYITTDPGDPDADNADAVDRTEPNYDPGSMPYDTEHFWRVDVVDDSNTYRGVPWSFVTVGGQVLGLEASSETWVRESAPDTTYNGDGLNVFNLTQGNPSETGRRISIIQFDLSEVAGETIANAELSLFQISSWSSYSAACIHDGYIISEPASVDELTWNLYRNNHDTGKDMLQGLGHVELSGGTLGDTWINSSATAADLAKIQAEVDGDGILTIALIAVEDGSDYRADYEDDVYFGNRPVLRVEFLTEKAFSPDPGQNSVEVPLDAALTWLPGEDAQSHNIYFGVNYNQVNNASDPYTLPGRGNQSLGDESYPPATLAYNQTYYWRIDEVSASGTSKGNIWSFTTVDGKAKDQKPADGAYVISREPTLTWTPGENAVEHHVYFGTDFTQLDTATDPAILPGRGIQFLGNESYTPAELLDVDTVYYWRIDEAVSGAPPAKGDVLSFHVTPSDPDHCDGVRAMGFDFDADYNDDCYVNVTDLALFAGDWLDTYDLDDYGILADNWRECDDPQGDGCQKPWLNIVKTAMETLITHGKDTYGPVNTPVLVSILNVDTLTMPLDPLNGNYSYCEGNLADDRFYDACMRTEGRPQHGRLSPAGSNGWLDQPLIRAMYLCSDMTTDNQYAQAADDYMSYMMANCKKTSGPSAGLFYWGSHSYWHAVNESYAGDGTHEILVKHANWSDLYRLNPAAVTTEAEKIWERHIVNETTGEHNRHDNDSRGLDFSFSGGSFATAFAFMDSVTPGSTWLDRARLMANRHWGYRNTTTNLVPEAPVAGTGRYDGHHCMTSVTGPHVSQLLYCYELTGDNLFRDIAIAYVKAYDKYGWDAQAGTYWGMLALDGTPIDGVKGVDGGYGAWAPKGYIDVWRTSMYSYEFPLIAAQAAIYAYEMSDYGSGKDPELLDIALRWAMAIENDLPPRLGDWWADEVVAAMGDVELTSGTYAENYGRAISFFVHLYQAALDEHYLGVAEDIATEAVQKLYKNGIFKGHPAKPYYQSNDGVGFLLYALLELHDVTVTRHGAF